MKKGESPRIEALEALIAEKRKHESYLAKLDERRAGTPEHVFVKLRDEYLTKLTDAQVRAQTEAESIVGGLDADAESVSEIEQRLAALEEEKVEGELRAAVGELDAKEWSKKLTSLNAAISVAERERDARSEIVQRTRALLAEALGADLPASSASSGKSGAPPKAGLKGGPSFDELAFLNSVVGRTSGATQGAPPPRSSRPVEQVSDPSSKEEAAPTSSPRPGTPKGERAVPANDEAPKPTARAEEPEEPAAPAKSEAEEATKASKKSRKKSDDGEEGPSAEKEDAFGRPTPRTSQAVKTLKCQECGTFNYPTEWYCERCGGELAAL